MVKRLVIIMLVVLLNGCYDSTLVFEDQYRVVVEGYLYMDRPVRNIDLTSMISFGNDSTGGEAITDAVVSIEINDNAWLLQENDSVPGNYEAGGTVDMSPGDSVILHIEYQGEVLSATTVIPDDPPTVNMSATSIEIPQVEDMMEFREMEFPDPLELTWNNPDGDYYFLNVQNIESNPVSIMPEPPDHFEHEGGGFVFQMITRPISDDHYEISMRDLTHYGTYRILFYSVNQEYVRLYESLDQDTRELNEPYSNITNGLGIFTAFNSDTLYFEVTK